MEYFCDKRVVILKSGNRALKELESEQSCQVFRVSLALLIYAIKDGWIGEILFHVFCNSSFPVNLLNDTHFQELAVDNLQKLRTPYEMCIWTAFNAQNCFNTMAWMSRKIIKKKLNIILDTMNSMAEGMEVQLM